LAAAIDLAILAPIAWVFCQLSALLSGLHLPVAKAQSPMWMDTFDFWVDLFLAGDPAFLGGLCLSLAIACTYLLLFHVIKGKTLGMRVCNLRIIDIYGDPPSSRQAFVRTVGYLLCVFSLGLGFLWIAFDSEKRGFHDWIARTYVVKNKVVKKQTPKKQRSKNKKT